MKKGSVGDNRVTSTRMSAEEVLRYFLMLFSSRQDAGSEGGQKDRIAVLSSLGAEDQVLTDMILSIKPDARIVVLDRGSLRPETQELMAATMKKYGLLYEVLSPVATEKEKMERDSAARTSSTKSQKTKGGAATCETSGASSRRSKPG